MDACDPRWRSSTSQRRMSRRAICRRPIRRRCLRSAKRGAAALMSTSTAQITTRVSLIATYAFDAATITGDNTGLQGNELANVPRHSGSVWLKGLVAHDFFVGGGAVMRGERQGDTQNTFQLPGYVSVDAFASYRLTVGAIQDRAADQRHEPDRTGGITSTPITSTSTRAPGSCRDSRARLWRRFAGST